MLGATVVILLIYTRTFLIYPIDILSLTPVSPSLGFSLLGWSRCMMA